MKRIAILTSQPVVDGVPLYLVAPAVREWSWDDGAAPFWQSEPTPQANLGRIRTRMVPVSLPVASLPCPVCDGDGVSVENGWCCEDEPNGCNGTGTVPAPWLLVNWQENVADASVVGGHWLPVSHRTPADAERRQVVVAESPAPDVLPVVAVDRDVEGHRWISLASKGRVSLIDRRLRSITPVTDEPWAANLRPGHAVWRFTPRLLDTPITEQRADVKSPVLGFVAWPLSLVEGQPTEVEV